MDRFDNRDNPAKLGVILPGYGTSTSVGRMPRSIPCQRIYGVNGSSLIWIRGRRQVDAKSAQGKASDERGDGVKHFPSFRGARSASPESISPRNLADRWIPGPRQVARPGMTLNYKSTTT